MGGSLTFPLLFFTAGISVNRPWNGLSQLRWFVFLSLSFLLLLLCPLAVSFSQSLFSTAQCCYRDERKWETTCQVRWASYFHICFLVLISAWHKTPQKAGPHTLYVIRTSHSYKKQMANDWQQIILVKNVNSVVLAKQTGQFAVFYR